MAVTSTTEITLPSRQPTADGAPVGPRKKGRVSLILAVVWLSLIVVAAALANVLPLSEASDPALVLNQPALAGPSFEHLLGTDKFGLDRFAQLIFGARVSLLVGLGGVSIGLIVGTTIGMIAAYFGGRIDGVVGFVTDVMLSFPPLVFLMTLATVITPSVLTVSMALGALAIPTFVRLARANTLRASKLGFVTMSRALGATNARILVRGILPNIISPLLSFALLLMAILIVAEASLSFLGLSIPSPKPPWGNMIAAAETQFQDHPIALVPAVALFFTVFSVNRIGDHFSVNERSE